MGVSVAIANLSKRYGRTEALRDISFDVQDGEFFALLGPNGAGKTTLLHILCTILAPDQGSIAVQGCDVVKDARGARENLGVVFQEPSLDDRLTVYENLEFHGLIYGVPQRLRRQRIDSLLDVVALADRRDTVVRALSSGMKRRLEIARALVHDSRVLILDEPTVGLDAQSRDTLWRHVATLRAERNLTIIVTTHYVEEVEACDRVCVIDKGQVAALDTPDALRAAYGHETLRLVARDVATRDDLLNRFADRITTKGDALLFSAPDSEFVDELLATYGTRVREFVLQPSRLEDAFLALTGRATRDQLAGARERTLAFGRQGGEHTR